MKDMPNNVLPLMAQQILKDAYKQAIKEAPDGLMRAKTIESAIRRVRRDYPRLFKDLCGR